MEKGVAEIIESRSLIDQYKSRQADLLKALDDAEKLDGNNVTLIAYLKAEIAKVREALADKQVALDAKQKEVDIYKAQLAKEIKKKNFFKKIAEFSTAAAVVAIAVIVFKQ